MKKVCFVVLMLGAVLRLYAFQSDTSRWKFSTHGFVNPVFYADSRQVVSGREGMMLFFPARPDFASDGEDINGVPSLNMLAITARLNLTIQGPDVLGAKMRGFIEGDFTGATDATINMFRLRHAYLDMRWDHHALLAGQYWHPMVIHEIMPMTQPLNMGAPFHPYARYNQLRYTYHVGSMEAVAVAAFQLDNKSQGPLGGSTQYLKTSMVPEMNVQLRYKTDNVLLGVAANFMHMRPNNTFTDVLMGIYLSDAALDTWSMSVFGKAKLGGWQVKAQTLLNNSLYEICSLGGYVATQNVLAMGKDADFKYRQWTFNTVWADLGRIVGKWRPGIFMGFAENNAFGDEIMNGASGVMEQVYGRGMDIKYLWRVQPRIEYFAGNGLTLSLEVEHTAAQYGRKDTGLGWYHYVADDDLLTNNTRCIFGITYAF